jgi:hypothetical protein
VEKLFQRIGVRASVFNELETVSAQRIFKQIGHGLAPSMSADYEGAWRPRLETRPLMAEFSYICN